MLQNLWEPLIDITVEDSDNLDEPNKRLREVRSSYISNIDGKIKRFQLVSSFEILQFFLAGIFCGFTIVLIAAIIFRNSIS